MKQSIGLVSLVVREYDQALEFFVDTLGFTLVEDRYVEEQDKRFVVVAPPGSSESRLVLARATSPEQAAHVGNQTGGRVFLFLSTDALRFGQRRCARAVDKGGRHLDAALR